MKRNHTQMESEDHFFIIDFDPSIRALNKSRTADSYVELLNLEVIRKWTPVVHIK
jgi:hypothetical protein